jgi:calcium-dependent protein kinase
MRSSRHEVAVKTLSTESDDPSHVESVRAEIENMLAMDHPHICRLLEVFEEHGQIRLVMERMKGPDLIVHLNRKGCAYSERDAARYVKQMCSAVAYCHKHGVCHRDLKLENFCLEDDSENARLKMIDFGLSEAFTSDPMTQAQGTIYYVAPEVLKRSYNEKCDMWSLGVITYIMLDGQAPFQGIDDRHTAQLICIGVYLFDENRWAQVSHHARNFIDSLLQLDPAQRLDAEGAQAHEWFNVMLIEPQASLVPLDATVLQGMRTFTQSNALKRAVLSAVAPVATVDEVSRWADQFETLDVDGRGTLPVQVLAKRLVELSNVQEPEASELSTALAAIDSGELVSYSAFLAACLSAHMTIREPELCQFFQQVDSNSDGYVSVEDVERALGDVVDVEALRNDLAGHAISYNEFRWFMFMPRLGPTKLGFRQLLAVCGGLTSAWKVDTKRAKLFELATAEDHGTMWACRRENMAWRIWKQQCQNGEHVAPETVTDVAGSPGFALAMDDCLLRSGLRSAAQLQRISRQDKRDILAFDLEIRGLSMSDSLLKMSDDHMVSLFLESESSIKLVRTADLLDEKMDADMWRVATTEAKEGSIEAARRENLAWRRWNINYQVA